jgi:hypothetical protein
LGQQRTAAQQDEAGEPPDEHNDALHGNPTVTRAELPRQAGGE